MRQRYIFWVGLGSLVLAGGGAISAVHMFHGNITLVASGFVGFAIGYRMIQIGVDDEGQESRHVSQVLRHLRINRRSLPSAVRYVVGITLSILLISYGFVVGAGSTNDPNLQAMILSGGSVVIGYIIGHIAANHEII